jgi:predicted acylesterase/phospholipase RssA
MNPARPSRHALVLSGGGASAAYEVGVMRALLHGESPSTDHRPIQPGILTGASAGAYNAAVLASRSAGSIAEALDHLAGLWRHRIADHGDGRGNGVYRLRLEPGDFLDPRRVASGGALRSTVEDLAFWTRLGLETITHLVDGPGSGVLRALGRLNLSDFFSTEPLRRLIQETLDLEAIRRSDRSLHIAITHWRTGLRKLYSNRDFVEPQGHLAVLASAAMPGIFPEVEIDGTAYVDGGVAANLPVHPALRAGADVLHVVRPIRRVKELAESPRTGSLETFFKLSAIDWAKNAGRGSWDVFCLDRLLAHAGRADASPEYRRGIEDCLKVMNLPMWEILQDGSEGSDLRRPVTLHSYRPSRSLGGVRGLLDFSSSRIDDLIALGYHDTLHHDCETSWCVLPGAEPPKWLREGWVPSFLW